MEADVGVGPWAGPWPVDPRYDPALLAEGDRRNVVDRYRYWRREAIVADLDTRRHDFHVAIENWQHDLNIGTVVRNANAFLAAEVHIIGKRKWNRRGAMVTDRYQHVRHHETIEEFVAWASGEGLPVIGIDNLPGARLLRRSSLPRRRVLLFGQEGPGLSDAARAGSERPGPSWPNSSRQRRGRVAVSRGVAPGRLSMPISGRPAPVHHASRASMSGWYRRCW